MATDPAPHLFWITSRAAGVTALVAASLAVSLGLLMATRVLKRFRSADLRVTHETLSLATMVAIAVHGISLIGDKYMHPSLIDVTVPFAGSYKTGWTAIGIVSGWALAALGLSYYARGRIGPERWRRLHRFTALAWALGLVHSLGESTDAGETWFLVMTGIVVVPALTLLLWRLAGGYMERENGRRHPADAVENRGHAESQIRVGRAGGPRPGRLAAAVPRRGSEVRAGAE